MGHKKPKGFPVHARVSGPEYFTLYCPRVYKAPLSSSSLLRRSGGVQGGLSNGENIVIKVAFKPTSTIAKKQSTVSRDGQDVDLLARGRHDPCVVPRAVPMVEAMVALVLADQLLQVVLVLIMPVLLPPFLLLQMPIILQAAQYCQTTELTSRASRPAPCSMLASLWV